MVQHVHAVLIVQGRIKFKKEIESDWEVGELVSL